MSSATIARLKVTMDDVVPLVLRRVEVPYGITLSRLHLVLQVAIGWTNSHLYEFSLGQTARWGVPDPDWPDGPARAAKATLAGVLDDGGTGSRAKLKYLYDFGDGWTHTIKVEGILAAVQGQSYPRLVEAKGSCPPEDIGGSFGYADFLEIIADPEAPRHDELLTWIGGAFDPDAVDVAAIEVALGKLAARWAKPRARPRGNVPREKPA